MTGSQDRRREVKCEHVWTRYRIWIAKWDGTHRYKCINCRVYVESYTGAIPEIEAKIKEKNA